jgi:hypothetical protein
MADAPRKKSPRAPSLALNDALDRAIRIYDKERLHPAATDIVASHIGYKSANNGSALSALASLRYYGLLERPKEGFLAVTKEVESFRYAPEEAQRQNLLLKFLKTPPLYVDLLEKYASGLPSDANLKYDLIQRGFSPIAAESVLSSFKQSVDFVGYYGAARSAQKPSSKADEDDDLSFNGMAEAPVSHIPAAAKSASPQEKVDQAAEPSDFDRIPVRLSGGRRAILLIPTPFFVADKARLKAQIDLLLAEDEDAGS